MSDTLDSKDITETAREAGFPFPPGWRVTASTKFDAAATPMDADCYSAKDIAAWKADEWRYVGVIVTVTDEDGREWGWDAIWSVEDDFTTDDGTTTYALDREDLITDLIQQAADEAAKAVAAFVEKWNARS